MFPLFSEDLNEWKNKIYFYNNYDLLIIINLLSNRSFKDLYQYPVFPFFYKPCKILNPNQERDLNLHLGLLELNEKSKLRKKRFLEAYNSSGFEIIDNDLGNNEKYLFSTFFSNPVFTCNYLLRIFPYSIIIIEIQGDGFDCPERLFYSIKVTAENTLAQKSDLRENIPELFYFPDIFENKNELNLGQLYKGHKVDNVIINDVNEDKFCKYEFIENLRNYFEYDNLKINNWIDLIFGKYQKENSKMLFFNTDMYIDLNPKKQEKLINK